jgi:hypothetical protein
MTEHVSSRLWVDDIQHSLAATAVDYQKAQNGASKTSTSGVPFQGKAILGFHGLMQEPIGWS